MSEQGRDPVSRRALVWGWRVVIALAALSAVAIVAAWATGGHTRALDACASGWDNFWVQCSAILICVTAATSVASTLAALVTRRGKQAASGLLRTALVFGVLAAAWVLLAIGGYGWHCP